MKQHTFNNLVLSGAIQQHFKPAQRHPHAPLLFLVVLAGILYNLFHHQSLHLVRP